jgi:hypothetical protein
VGSEDTVTVGLTEDTHRMLQRLKEDNVFNEMVDGYRLGIALAIARRQIAPEGLKMRTFVNAGSLDPDLFFKNMIIELYPDLSSRPYAAAERLAEWGVAELGRRHEAGLLRFTELFEEEAEASK